MAQDTKTGQFAKDQLDCLVGGSGHGLDADFRVFGFFIGRIDASEVFEFAAASLFVESLGIASFGLGQRGIHENFDEFTLGDEVAGHAPFGAKRGDERHHHDEPSIDHQAHDFRHPADVFHTVGIGETQIAAESVPDVVAIEDVGMLSGREQALFQKVGDGRLARTGNPRKPDGAGLLALNLRARSFVNVQRLPMYVSFQADTSFILRQSSGCRLSGPR